MTIALGSHEKCDRDTHPGEECLVLKGCVHECCVESNTKLLSIDSTNCVAICNSIIDSRRRNACTDISQHMAAIVLHLKACQLEAPSW